MHYIHTWQPYAQDLKSAEANRANSDASKLKNLGMPKPGSSKVNSKKRKALGSSASGLMEPEYDAEGYRKFVYVCLNVCMYVCMYVWIICFRRDGA